MNFEKWYQESDCVWGAEPNALLKDWASMIPTGPVLDLGAGEGRSALYLAARGHAVTAIDLAPSAIARCQAQAEAASLPITTHVGDLVEFPISPAHYAAIMAFYTLHFLPNAAWPAVLARLQTGVKPGGLVLIESFLTADPLYAEAQLRDHHYFAPGELRAAFATWDLLHYTEAIQLDPGHPGMPAPHDHHTVLLVARRI